MFIHGARVAIRNQVTSIAHLTVDQSYTTQDAFQEDADLNYMGEELNKIIIYGDRKDSDIANLGTVKSVVLS